MSVSYLHETEISLRSAQCIALNSQFYNQECNCAQIKAIY